MLERIEDLTEEEKQAALKYIRIKRRYRECCNLWQEFICLNHHKTRDFCYFIKSQYDFFVDEFRHKASHEGYYVDYEITREYNTPEEAITECILNSFNQIKDWCQEVRTNEDEYELEQIKQANYYFKIEPRLKELRKELRNESKLSRCD